MPTNAARNKNADEYSTKWECLRIQYETNLLWNTVVWNEDAEECSMKWGSKRVECEAIMLTKIHTEYECLRMQYEMNMPTGTAWN